MGGNKRNFKKFLQRYNFFCLCAKNYVTLPKNRCIMYKKELRYYFSTPVAYIVIGLFLLLISLFLWVLPGEWNIIESGYAQADGLFALAPWLFLLLCPALTMRLFAEERQTGTWNLLLTKPISLARIVWMKYLAAWTIVLIALLPCLVHYVALLMMAEPQGNVDSGAFFGSFIGLAFIALSYIAIGTFCSSLTKSQIVSFILSLLGCALFFYGFDLLAALFSDGAVVNAIRSFGGYAHYTSMARGVIDLRDLVYFASVALLFIFTTIFSLSRQHD